MKTKSFAEKAEAARRSARRCRILSNTFFVLAALFAVAGVTMLIITGQPKSLITVLSSVVIALNAGIIRTSISTNESAARMYDQLAKETA